MKTKKLIAFVLTLTMALTLCACGAKDTETAPKTVAEVQTTAAPETAAPETTEAAPAEITVTDMIGREVTVTPAATRRLSASARVR